MRAAPALLVLAILFLAGVAPPDPPREVGSGWEQYVSIDLLAWDGQLLAHGFVESFELGHEGGLRGDGRALATPGWVGGYLDPNLPPPARSSRHQIRTARKRPSSSRCGATGWTTRARAPEARAAVRRAARWAQVYCRTWI